MIETTPVGTTGPVTIAGLRASALWPVLHAVAARTPRGRLGVDPAGLQDPMRWVSLRVADRLWGLAGARTALALGSCIEPRTFGHLTYLLAAAPTVGESLRCLQRYYGLLSHGARYEIERAGTRTRIEMVLVEAPRRPAASELFLVAVTAGFLRRHSDGWCAQEIRLRQAPPAHHELPQWSHALAAPLRFEAERTIIEFPSAALSIPMRTAEPGLARVLEEHARVVLAGDAEPMTSAQVRACLQTLAPGPGSVLERVAAELGTSARHLRRRLQEEGTSFRILLDEVQAAAAGHLLDDPACDVAEVAERLGYGDLVAFRRAFRRWFGLTPAAYRRARPVLDRVVSSAAAQ